MPAGTSASTEIVDDEGGISSYTSEDELNDVFGGGGDDAAAAAAANPAAAAAAVPTQLQP